MPDPQDEPVVIARCKKFGCVEGHSSAGAIPAAHREAQLGEGVPLLHQPIQEID
jgi:predicted NBD/HSP70 family sugar kinase